MGIFQKPKTIRRKWIYLGLVLLVLAGAGGIAGKAIDTPIFT